MGVFRTGNNSIRGRSSETELEARRAAASTGKAIQFAGFIAIREGENNNNNSKQVQ
jgi:hypothetical protein